MRNLLIVTVLLSYTCTCFKHKQENKCAVLGGECISLEKCDELKPLIHKSRKDRDYVIKQNCGFDGFVSRVCCPKRKQHKCITSEGILGTCVSIEKCSHPLEHKKSFGCAARNSVCCDVTRYDIPKITSHINTDDNPQNSDSKGNSSGNQTLGFMAVDGISNNNTTCGIAPSNKIKIIGGQETAIDGYPWLAMLEYQTNQPYQCGGSLISSLYVLTAAHCLVTETKISRGVNAVRLGEYNITNDGKDCVEAAGGGIDCTDGAVTITINKMIYHPHYLSVENVREANDIGLLGLSKSAPYTDFIRPICLPSSDVTKVAISSGLTFQAAGWGAVSDIKQRSDVKLEVDLPMLEQKICKEQFSMVGKTILWDKQFCAGGELNKDTCKGDSGGPLTYSADYRKHQIVGITSFGTVRCGLQGRSSVFTKVIEYLPWIVDTTKVQS